MAASQPAGDNSCPPQLFYLDSFASRQWDDPKYQGTHIDHSKEDFVKRVHQHHQDGAQLVDGYAPFCKHAFIPNFVGAKAGNVKITDHNREFVETGYEARSPGELAVLSRWIPASKVDVPEAKMLDVILYSREQIVKELQAMPGKGNVDEVPQVPWGIISIKAQDEDYETPMQPITMMRNALGAKEGGSGVPLDRQKYDASVAYWKQRVPVLDR